MFLVSLYSYIQNESYWKKFTTNSKYEFQSIYSDGDNYGTYKGICYYDVKDPRQFHVQKWLIIRLWQF
jgi:hypothetical protein